MISIIILGKSLAIDEERSHTGVYALQYLTSKVDNNNNKLASA